LIVPPINSIVAVSKRRKYSAYIFEGEMVANRLTFCTGFLALLIAASRYVLQHPSYYLAGKFYIFCRLTFGSLELFDLSAVMGERTGWS